VLRFEDEVDVRIRAAKLGRTSITWAWEISRDGEVCVTGSHVVVNVDADGRPTELASDVRAALAP
jgi:acyl-CoA thioester hydrolase